MGSQMGSIGLTLINTLFNLFVFVLMLRFALHASRADYYNPMTQGVVKATGWLVHPLQRLLRPIGRFDLASLVAAILVKIAALLLIFLLFAGTLPPVLNLLIAGFAGALNALVKIYFFALIVMIILSWVAPRADHPGALLVIQVTEPIMSPLRRVIPPLGMLDLSPIVAFILINLIDSIVVSSLVRASMLPARVVVGY
ncbi:YggT family protein [Halotalea alkalilenta]|uniref:YggT family protein n=1 Tax=Halotalea alkalilenta TaxID=376489 RepID=A0A172YAK7_9GAMM|nr:YggT family protein [Halotalea alkalilenta]ANF56055.1 hypothetical protein A5892_00045 [Halotalea alkalilenta]